MILRSLEGLAWGKGGRDRRSPTPEEIAELRPENA